MRINIYILFCFIGHTFASVSKEESCLECYGVDKISLQSFKVYTKETARQRTEDYEEQGARPKQPRINQPETVIYPEDVDIISHRREGHSGEITNLSIQTTSVDNSEKLTPEYQQVGFKTSTRKDNPRKKKKNRHVEKSDISIELGFKISTETTQQRKQKLSTRHDLNRESSPGNYHGREWIHVPIRPADINNDFPALEQRNYNNPVSKMLISVSEPLGKDSDIHTSFRRGKWNSSKKFKKEKK